MTTKIKTTHAYLDFLIRTAQEVDSDIVDQIAKELLGAYFRDRSVFVLGNGGSAATASHFACDLAKGAIKWLHKDAKRFRIIALTDNVPLLTAWANDSRYEDVFAEQLQNFVRRDDVVIAISGSGNSPNVLKALTLAQAAGARTIGLTGFMGGKMISLCQHCVVVPSDNMEVIEDLHMAICHSLTTTIRTALGEFGRDQVAVPALQSKSPAAMAVCSDSVTNRGTLLQMTATSLGLREFGSRFDARADRETQNQVDAD